MSAVDNATIVALISAVFGGSVVKIIDGIFGVKKRDSDIQLAEKKLNLDADTTARVELRLEAQRHRDALVRSEAEAERLEAGFRATIKRVEDERDSWREKYYSQRSDSARNDPAGIVQIQRYLSEIDSLRDQKKQLQRSNDDLTARIRTLDK